MQKQPKQNTPEWYDSRKNFIGASEAATVMGISPWKTEYKLWQEKTGLVQPSTYQSPAMKEGSAREKEALDFYNGLTGRSCEDTVFISEDHRFMRASLDGYCVENHVGVEIKCPQEKTFEKLAKDIPKYYYAQIQHQMFCAKLKKIDFFVYRDADTFSLKTIEYDEEFCIEMVEKETLFWARVLSSTSPNKIKGDFVEKDSVFSDFCENYCDLQEKRKAIDEELLFTFKKMVSIANNENSFHGKFYLKKHDRKGCVDYSSIPELDDVDLDSYRKKGCEFWKLQCAD